MTQKPLAASFSMRWMRRLLFCACGTTLVIVMLAVILVVMLPYDVDVIVESYLDDDLVELDAKIAAGNRLREAAQADAPNPSSLTGKRKKSASEHGALMDQILNPNLLDPDGLLPCSSSANDLTGHKSAEAWAAKKIGKLKESWQKFTATSVERLARTRYCIAQCGYNRCCAGTDGYRWGSDDDWYYIVKNDLKPTTEEDGLSDITLVTQGSFDRVDVFGMIAHAWVGPKVAAFTVYNHTPELASEAERQLQEITAAASTWSNVKVLVYFVRHNRDFYTNKFRKHDATVKPLLPLNTLRNIVVDQAQTNFVFTCDMDFVPSSTLYTKVRTFLMPAMAAIDRGAFVVPHWEALECDNTVRVPSNFEKIVEYGQQGIVRPFHVSTRRLMPSVKELRSPPHRCIAPSALWSFGVQTTNYIKWYKESQAKVEGIFPLKVEGPLQDKYWEPFVIVKRVEPSGATLPRYPEQFVGRYKNKISFITTLRGYHYQFFTIRREFLTHVPHPTANASAPAMHDHLLDMRRLHTEDRQYLHEQIWSTSVDPPLESSPFDKGLHCTSNA